MSLDLSSNRGMQLGADIRSLSEKLDIARKAVVEQLEICDSDQSDDAWAELSRRQKKLDAIGSQMDSLRGERESRKRALANLPSDPREALVPGGRGGRVVAHGYKEPVRTYGESEFIDAKTGERLQTISAGDEYDSEQVHNVFGGLLEHAVGRGGSGYYAGTGVITGVDSAGGAFVEASMWKETLKYIGARTVVMRLGAREITSETPELHIGTVESEPTAIWRPEGSTITATSVSFGRKVARSKTLAVLIPFSVEWGEDVTNGVQLLQEATADAIARKVDYAAMRGAGNSSEPLGVLSTSGIQTVTSVGVPGDYVDASSAIRKIYGANFDGQPSELGWVMSPAIAEVYDGLTDSTGQPLMPTPWAGALQKQMTTAMADSSMLIGDFRNLLIVTRASGVRFEVLPAGTAVDDGSTTHNAVSEMKRFLRAYIRLDVVTLRPAFFWGLTGVSAS